MDTSRHDLLRKSFSGIGHRRSAGILVVTLLIAVFNLFFAIRPATAPGPPIKAVPEDIFLHPGWANHNYIGQGRYLNHLFDNLTITTFEDSIVLEDFFQRY